MTHPATASPAATQYLRQERRHAVSRRLRITAWQVLILAIILGAWEGLTRIPWFVQNTLFDPFFISQPSRVAVRLWQWLQPGPQSVWPHLWLTLQATLVGLAVGVSSGLDIRFAAQRDQLRVDRCGTGRVRRLDYRYGLSDDYRAGYTQCHGHVRRGDPAIGGWHFAGLLRHVVRA